MATVATDTIKKELREFIVEEFLFGDDSNPFEDDASFMKMGLIDSTGVLGMVSFIEENYGVEVADEEMIPVNLDSLNNLATYIQKKTM